jgi:hypothetical protein
VKTLGCGIVRFRKADVARKVLNEDLKPLGVSATIELCESTVYDETDAKNGKISVNSSKKNTSSSSNDAEDKKNRTLFVENLAMEATEKDIIQCFNKFGKIEVCFNSLFDKLVSCLIIKFY